MKTRQKLIRMLSLLLLGALLALAFLAYLQPSFVLDLANRFVLC